ncbi:MAG: hypothetical protein Q9169_007005 [Polycauliona sp. 2 TL-2023]
MSFRAAGRSLRQCQSSLKRPIPFSQQPPPPFGLHQSSSPLRAIIPSFQSRTYAKPARPKKPYEYQPPSRHTPSTSQPGSPIPSTRPPNTKEDAPDYSKSQDEFGTRAESAFNGEPQSSGSGPGTTSASTPKPSDHPEYSTLQDEFNTNSSSDRNTAPQSTSPSAIDPAEAQAQQQQSSKPLPDLTQGIPSTLEAELDQAQRASQDTAQDMNMEETPAGTSAAGGRRGGGDLPKSANITSMERRRNRFANYMYATLLGLSIFGTVYLGRNWESEEEESKHPNAPSGWGFGLFYNRASARLADMLDYYNEPAFAKLLPNPDPAWERPYTLVLSLEDLLVHSHWTREHGWRMAKRPGVDYFLRYLSQYYEIVIFTSLPSMTGDPIIRKLDPYRVVMWPLFREATRYKNGEYIKDLDYLNRPLSRTILLDTHAPHASLQPNNAIILPKWKGAPADTELVSFIPFLEYIASMGFTDVRDVLKSFSGTHIPSEYSKRESIAKERMQKQFAEENKKGKRKSSSGGGLLGAFGGGSAGMMGGEESLSEGFEKGKTYMDQVRERGQRQYEILDKEIRENGEKWLKEMAAEEKKMQDEAMKGMQTKVFGGFFGGGGEAEKK